MADAAIRQDFSPRFCAPEARPWILTAAILVSALGFIDGSVVSIATPAMRVSLDATLPQAQWISNAYMLPLSALILVGGAAGDRFGIARVIMAGLALFMIASIVSALAPSAEVLIAGRALKGIGAALMIPGSLALIARAFPKGERGAAIGTWAAASAITTALGPILGGLLLSTIGDEAWRWIFAANIPFGAIIFWILLRRVGEDPPASDDPLDWVGAALATLALGAGAFALTSSGTTSSVAALPSALFVIPVVAFVIWEARTPHPMVPLGLFRNRTFSAANIATFALYFALSAILFYQPMTVISSWGVSAWEASLAFAPLSVFIGVMSAWAGRTAERVGAGRMIAVGSAIVALSCALMALAVPTRAFWAALLPLNAVMAFGMAFVVSPLSTAVMGAVSDAQSGTASGINNAVSRAAGLVAVAAMGSIAAAIYFANGGTLSFGASGGDAAHRAATDAGFQTVLWITSTLAAFSALVAWFGIERTDAAD